MHGRWRAYGLVVPFIEQSVERGGTPTFAILAAGRLVAYAKWLVCDLTAERSVIFWDAEIERNRAIGQSTRLNKARARAL